MATFENSYFVDIIEDLKIILFTVSERSPLQGQSIIIVHKIVFMNMNFWQCKEIFFQTLTYHTFLLTHI